MTAVSVLCGYYLTTVWTVVLGAGAFGQEIRFRPIRSAPWIGVCDGDGTTSCTVDEDCAGPDGLCNHVPPAVGTIGSALNASFNGTCWEVSFAAGEVEVDIALEATGWDQAAGAPSLGAIQATVVSDGYDNGSLGVLEAKGWPGSLRDGVYQPTNICTDDGRPCNPPFDGTCNSGPDGPPSFCINNPDFVMPACANALSAIAAPTLNYAWATAAQTDCNDSSGGVFKGFGGLILEVPIDAAGTYLIDLDRDPNNSFMTSGAGTPIAGVVFTPACITLPCKSDTDCSDGLSCTTDFCNQQAFTCQNDIVVGSCLIEGVCYSNGQEDPADSCRFCATNLSQTDWSNRIEGEACGDPTDVECNGADTCDGAGSCLTNVAPPGTACTDDGDDCTTDTCSAGACTHENSLSGTPCGDPTDTPCNRADTCNGNGTCLENIFPDGIPCPNGAFCDGIESCQGGACQSTDPPCDAETHVCDERNDQCDLLGDYDGNLLVTLSDFLNWRDCETGPAGGPYARGCEVFDFEQNGFVDLRDYGRFQEVFTAP